MDGQTSRGGQLAIAASAMGYGVGTALSVVALHGERLVAGRPSAVR